MSALKPSVDDECSCCLEKHSFHDNPIVYCSECQTPVHVQCYGNPLVRRIEMNEPLTFKCDQCMNHAYNASCCLCFTKNERAANCHEENKDGIEIGAAKKYSLDAGMMKRTTANKWAHLICATWVPEVFFRDVNGREIIDCLQVPQHNWLNQKPCVYCQRDGGIRLECCRQNCVHVMHVPCAIANGCLLQVLRTSYDNNDVVDPISSLSSSPSPSPASAITNTNTNTNTNDVTTRSRIKSSLSLSTTPHYEIELHKRSASENTEYTTPSTLISALPLVSATARRDQILIMCHEHAIKTLQKQEQQLNGTKNKTANNCEGRKRAERNINNKKSSTVNSSKKKRKVRVLEGEKENNTPSKRVK